MLSPSRVRSTWHPAAALTQVFAASAASFGKRTVANPPVWLYDEL
jgi:hypothetical protein